MIDEIEKEKERKQKPVGFLFFLKLGPVQTGRPRRWGGGGRQSESRPVFNMGPEIRDRVPPTAQPSAGARTTASVPMLTSTIHSPRPSTRRRGARRTRVVIFLCQAAREREAGGARIGAMTESEG